MATSLRTQPGSIFAQSTSEQGQVDWHTGSHHFCGCACYPAEQPTVWHIEAVHDGHRGLISCQGRVAREGWKTAGAAIRPVSSVDACRSPRGSGEIRKR